MPRLGLLISPKPAACWVDVRALRRGESDSGAWGIELALDLKGHFPQSGCQHPDARRLVHSEIEQGESPMHAQRTVLVVDDDPLILAGVAAALVAAGFRVWTTESGEEAMRLVERHRPEVVVTDLRMPGMDGLSLLDRLARRRGPVPEAAIIYSAAPPPSSEMPRTHAVRWIPKTSGHEALIDALMEGQQHPIRDA